MAKVLWAIWYWAAMLWFGVAVLVVSVVMIAAMVVTALMTRLWDREAKLLNPVSHLYARLIFWINPLWKVRVVGRENIDPKRAYVITANHQSMFDIPLAYFLPRRRTFKWVARKGIYKWAVFGQILWLQRNITVDKESKGASRAEVIRSAKRFLARSKKVLNEGWSVVVFPEGTRSRTGEMGAFEGGAFKLATDNGVEVLPVAFSYMKGKYKGVRRITLSVLPPILGTDAKELAERDRELIRKELVRLENDGTKE